MCCRNLTGRKFHYRHMIKRLNPASDLEDRLTKQVIVLVLSESTVLASWLASHLRNRIALFLESRKDASSMASCKHGFIYINSHIDR
jgi:hypothetical protein